VIISIIAAVSFNKVIGQNNKIPWHLPADLRYFKEKTTGHCIIMGRKNFESIGRVLPNRSTIVITRNKFYEAPGAIIVHSLEEAIRYAKENDEREAFVCGGADIYKLALPISDKMYYTQVCAEVEGNVFFPEWNEDSWCLDDEVFRPADEANEFDLFFREYWRL